MPLHLHLTYATYWKGWVEALAEGMRRNDDTATKWMAENRIVTFFEEPEVLITARSAAMLERWYARDGQ